MKKNSFRRFLIRFSIIGVISAFILPPLLYFAGEIFAHTYARYWADKLIELDNEGRLSTRFGAAWQDVIYRDELDSRLERIDGSIDDAHRVDFYRGVPLENYPSLSVVERLNTISEYSSRILITDRHGESVAEIRTDYTRVSYDQLPQVFIDALVAAEDNNFFENNYGFEYRSFVRAAIMAGYRTLLTGRKHSAVGTSSITQQVAKMFVSELDTVGMRYVARSVDRKIQELRLAAALRKRYTAKEIMEVYVNHCITSSYGLIGVADISMGLWGVPIQEISDAQAIYLARMVKWGANFPERIKRQCRIDMPRMAARLNWDEDKQKEVLKEIDELTTLRPQRVITENGHLVDLANIVVDRLLARYGYSEEERKDFDIINPDALVRRKGNLHVQLTIDLGLQKFLEEQVEARGFGADTTVITEARVGSFGEDIVLKKRPQDTLRALWILSSDTILTEPTGGSVSLKEGDTVIVNTRYRKLDEKNLYRRSLFFYHNRPVLVDGQYYAYSIMDSETGELLAYYSRDRIGSRCASLFGRAVPNGSSTAKPLLYAYLFDLGHFEPYDKWSDELPVTEDLPWRRSIVHGRGGQAWARFYNVGRGSPPYEVQNAGRRLGGEDYIYNHLNRSNNILGVESIYRMNGTPFKSDGSLDPTYFNLAVLLRNLELYDQFRESHRGREITGVRLYRELARVVGADVDGRRGAPIFDSLYSVSLGTLELTLFEQMHLFNALYNNQLIRSPKDNISLFAKEVKLENRVFSSEAFKDTIRVVHPYSSLDVLRPIHLGLHRRLNGPYDGLRAFDVDLQGDSPMLSDSLLFSDNYFSLSTPISNYAKSGTTNDVLRPFNEPAGSTKRTNYGHWNAVLRVDLSKFSDNERERDVRDITVACIGEGNRHYTGNPDGKTLHRFLTTALLKEGGIEVSRGYFSAYEEFLKRVESNHRKLELEPLDYDSLDVGVDLF